MLQLALKIFQSILLVIQAYWTAAYAHDDSVSRGIETFRETCLMADPRSERIYEWATDRGLKIVQGQGPERAGAKVLTWEIAKSGDSNVALQVRVSAPAWVNFT